MYFKSCCFLMGTLALVSGCSSAPPPQVVVQPAKPEVVKMANQLQTAGMQVIQQGDRLTIVIPTDLYFEPMSATVKDNQQTNLRQMAKFVKNFTEPYPHSVIRVTGYTDQVYSQIAQLKLSQNYASAISSYLFDAGINPQRIATQARGSNEPVAAQTPAASLALNRRVVVQVN